VEGTALTIGGICRFCRGGADPGGTRPVVGRAWKHNVVATMIAGAGCELPRPAYIVSRTALGAARSGRAGFTDKPVHDNTAEVLVRDLACGRVLGVDAGGWVTSRVIRSG
jgi:hypothetical protein